MDFMLLSEFIGNVGFPVAVCVALFIQNNKTIEAFNSLKEVADKNTYAIQALNDLKYMVDKNTDAVEMLTYTINREEEKKRV